MSTHRFIRITDDLAQRIDDVTPHLDEQAAETSGLRVRSRTAAVTALLTRALRQVEKEQERARQRRRGGAR